MYSQQESYKFTCFDWLHFVVHHESERIKWKPVRMINLFNERFQWDISKCNNRIISTLNERQDVYQHTIICIWVYEFGCASHFYVFYENGILMQLRFSNCWCAVHYKEFFFVPIIILHRNECRLSASITKISFWSFERHCCLWWHSEIV